ncbi:MAG: hypothetical protein JXA73_15785, partial [Acidobacteria bacterium]|nr:hypothetical protein [Acidobacteriota bacterium]
LHGFITLVNAWDSAERCTLFTDRHRKAQILIANGFEVKTLRFPMAIGEKGGRRPHALTGYSILHPWRSVKIRG